MQERRFGKAKTDGSLWEGEEQVVRWLVEESKVNLLIRLLDEYESYLLAAGDTVSVSARRTACPRIASRGH